MIALGLQVAGNFHFAVHKSDQHALMHVFEKKDAINVSHIIHSISFGKILHPTGHGM